MNKSNRTYTLSETLNKETSTRLKNNPVFFCRAVWKMMGYDKVAPIGPPEEQMIEWLNGGTRVPNKRGVLAPRGIGKTHMAAGVAAYRLNRFSDTKVLIVQRAEVQAKQTVRLILGWFNAISWLRHLKPIRRKRHRSSTTEFDIGTVEGGHRTPSLAAASVTGTLEGRRSSLTIVDDAETDMNTLSIDSRNALAARLSEIVNITSYHQREIVFIGTYHHEDSVYLKEVDKGCALRTWPILYPTPEEIADENGTPRMVNLAPKLVADLNSGRAQPGEKVFPHRHSDKQIEEAKGEGETNWNMQFMLIVALGGAKRYPLRFGDLITFDAINEDVAPRLIHWGLSGSGGQSSMIEDLHSVGFGDDGFRAPILYAKDWVPYQDTKMFVDPSGKGVNRTGYAVIGLLNGRLWVKALGSLSGGYDEETLEKLCQIAKRCRALTVYVEDNFGQGAISNLLKERLQRHFVTGVDHKPGQVSGSDAVRAAREHQEQAEKTKWACTVVEVRQTGYRMKEDRMLDVLEPVSASHRLIIDRAIASDKRFQTQWSRIRRVRGCLSQDDELDALASCVKQFSGDLDTPLDLPQQSKEDEGLDDELADFRSPMSFGQPETSTIIKHR